MSDNWYTLGGEQWASPAVHSGPALWGEVGVFSELLNGRGVEVMAADIQRQLPEGAALELVRIYPASEEGVFVVRATVRMPAGTERTEEGLGKILDAVNAALVSGYYR